MQRCISGTPCFALGFRFQVVVLLSLIVERAPNGRSTEIRTQTNGFGEHFSSKIRVLINASSSVVSCYNGLMKPVSAVFCITEICSHFSRIFFQWGPSGAQPKRRIYESAPFYQITWGQNNTNFVSESAIKRHQFWRRHANIQFHQARHRAASDT